MARDLEIGERSNNVLRIIVEQGSPCPTLRDLDGIARKRLSETVDLPVELSQHERWMLEEHLPACEDCERIYQGMLVLGKASAKAIAKVENVGFCDSVEKMPLSAVRSR